MNFKHSSITDFSKVVFENNPSLKDKILSLKEYLHCESIVSNFIGNDKINFLSWLSEMKCGVYLQTLSFQLEYEKRLEYTSRDSEVLVKCPDWLCYKEGQTVMVEVLRINLPNHEMFNRIGEFENKYKSNVISIENASIDMNSYRKLRDKLVEKRNSYLEIMTRNGYSLVIFIDCSSRFELGVTEFETLFQIENDGFELLKEISAVVVLDFFGQYHYVVNSNTTLPLNTSLF